MSFTQGPWRVEEGRSIVASWDTGETVQIASMSRSRWDTASSNGRNERMWDALAADARLIAAAPDLLKALKQVILYFKADDEAMDYGELCVAIDEAIAKAVEVPK